MISAIKNLFLDPRAAARWLLAASAGSLATALVAQFGFGLQPCDFCIYQRWPYVAVIALSALALLRPRRARWLLWACALAFAVNLGLAITHVGLEQGWWQIVSECTAPAGQATSLGDLRRQLMATPMVRCDKPAWSFLGLSFAGFNLIASALLLGYSAAMAMRARDTG